MERARNKKLQRKGYVEMKIEEDKFSQNVIILHVLAIDRSGSMSQNSKEDGVRKCLKVQKDSLMNLEDSSNVRVAVIEFGSSIKLGNFKTVEKLSTKYSAKNEGTRLYDAIKEIWDECLGLYEEYCIKRGYTIVLNIVFLSDGQDYTSEVDEEIAKFCIDELKEKLNAGILIYDIDNTVSNVARRLGIQVKPCDSSEQGFEEMSEDMSQMLVESSQSCVPIGVELSKGQLSESAIASKQFKEAMSNAKTVDMLSDDIFDILYS